MTVKILTPEFSKEFEAQAVYLPGTLCPFEVLPGHEAIVSTLSAGKLRWLTDGAEESLEIKGGACRFRSDNMVICAEV